jgi:hexulose-6-phosphate isomerase
MSERNLQLTRRSFLAGCAAGPLTLAAGAGTASAAQGPWKKALVVSDMSRGELEAVKKAGFAGVETRAADAPPDKAAATRKTAEDIGIKIHSVMRGWMNFNSRKKADIKASMEKVKTSLRAAEAYGAGAVLMIPCRVGDMNMPNPWEFDVEFDPETLHVKRVVKGDNEPYAEYIRAQNRATDASREAVKRLVPAAEKHGVVICLENVWNNLWVTPELFAAFVKSFDSPWVQAYFDIGNHVKYGKPQNYVRELGSRIGRVHVKDFQLKPSGHGGKFVPICEGSVDYPKVMKALRKAGYEGWTTIEGRRGLSLSQLSKRLDTILAGKSC